MEQISPVSFEDVKLSIADSIISLSGNITQINPERYMAPFFQNIHTLLCENEQKNINVNIENLKFLNSAGIKVIIDWIIKVTELPVSNRYTITFLCDPHSCWQRASIDTLSIIDSNIVKFADS